MKENSKYQTAYKFRLYPSKNQEKILLETLELCRQTYNLLLEELNNQKIIDKSEISALLPDLKICNPKLNKVYSKVLQPECDRLFNNLRALSKLKKKGKKIGSLRYKSKKNFKTFTYNQSGFKVIKINNRRLKKLHLSKIGKISLRSHKEIKGKIKQIAIKRTNSNKWYACISCELDREFKKINHSNKQIGIDLGLTNYVYDSEGNHYDNPRFLNKSLENLKKKQRKLSRKKRGSKNRNKQRAKLAKLHEKIENQRNDFLHKLSRKYVNDYSLIAIENLQINNMIQNKYLSRAISDASWRKFIKMLEYKAESAGVQVIKVNPRGTTQKCSKCDKIVAKSLRDRGHNCDCGLNIHRDFNSALKILKDATVGSTGSNAWENVSMETSMNQEFAQH